MGKEKNRTAILINSFPHKMLLTIQILEIVVKKNKPKIQKYNNKKVTNKRSIA